MFDLRGVLNDRDAMLAILREAAEDPAHGGNRPGIVFQMETADALGDADLAVDALRRFLGSAEGFDEGRMHHETYRVHVLTCPSIAVPVERGPSPFAPNSL